VYTFYENRGPIKGKTVAWIGDANNMCYGWIQAAQVFDFKLHVSTPTGYGIPPERANHVDRKHLEVFADPMKACVGAHLVTTDVWTSMGFEAESEARKKAFGAFTVDARMMAEARPESLFMHCLPAHRGEEVSAEVLEGPQSVVWEEAENRLHVQKALMEYLLLGRIET
jgi:ornithine carbamoyltransferase